MEARGNRSAIAGVQAELNSDSVRARQSPKLLNRRSWNGGLYIQAARAHDDGNLRRNFSCRSRSTAERNKIMGDKSPKSNQKKNSQKQAKVSSADQKKKSAIAAQASAGKKK